MPIPGKRSWARFCGSYGLPDGLDPRTPLVVVDREGFCGRLRDVQGRLWKLNRVQIDAGFSFYLDGGKIHESHPKCAAYQRHGVQKLRVILRVGSEEWDRAVSRFVYHDDLPRTR